MPKGRHLLFKHQFNAMQLKTNYFNKKKSQMSIYDQIKIEKFDKL